MRIDTIYKTKCDEPSDINEHLPTLRRYATSSIFVTEFGVRHIVSTWALIAGRPRRVVSYDLSSPGQEALDHLYAVADEAGVMFTFHQADVRFIKIDQTDLLFIDTYHTYTQLRTELQLHAEKARKWIILHDTVTFGERGEALGEKGLNCAIDEFLQVNSHWKEIEKFPNNNGLTVLGRTV